MRNMRTIIKLTKMKQVIPLQKSIVKLNSSVNELNQKVLFINDIMVYQFLLYNTVYFPLGAFYMVYN